MLGKLGKLCCAVFALTLGLTLAPPAPAAPAGSARPVASGVVAASSTEGYDIYAAQFNILSSVMARGGPLRAARAADEVRRTGRDVVAFEEVASDQLRVLQRRLPRFSFWPRRTLDFMSRGIQIAWNANRFRRTGTGAIYVPVFGRARAVPYVQLKDLGTGRRFWVIAIHNSAGRSHEGERDVSTRKEIRLIQRLEAQGRPVLVLGDVNERIEFCQKVAGATRQMSMDGTRRQPCPISPGGQNDWMLGSDRGLRYSRFRKIRNGISDHPMVICNVRVVARS